MKRITGHLTEKNGNWYGVINLKDENGKRKEKWVSLDLEAKRGSRGEAEFRLNEVLSRYNSSDMYLDEFLTHAERERRRKAEMPAEEYIIQFLEQHKPNISQLTYVAYKRMVDNRIAPYFKSLNIKLKEVTGDEVNDFYTKIRSDGLKGTSAQRYHSLLHLAFKHAVKRRIIPSNPCDQADRPKSVPYISEYLNADEIITLVSSLEGDPIRMVVILAAYYGLRRSEIIGLKWSAIDFSNKTITIRHKVVELDKGRRELLALDVMKTKSSYRTLPLIPYVEEELKKEYEHQAEMRRMFGKSYNQQYTEYVCVDAIGRLINPNYVSDHFQVILKRCGLKRVRFHDLRHSCASLMLANGIQMKMIQDWLGHSDMSTTANIYSHIDSASKLGSANVIGNVLAVK